MRLLNTTTYKLKSVVNPMQEKYVILSHTWSEELEEISFQDLDSLESKKKTSGYAKLKKTCQLAAAKLYQHAWIDTCCIDKASSAELSEAINSMFVWYREAQVCYVHLADFEPFSTTISKADKENIIRDKLPACRWIRRGWTLQELIAPRSMLFFDKEWNEIGNKKDLEHILSDVTKIPTHVLRDSSMIRNIPIAHRMSWAARRETTRIEDQAYSLLGIFDVNMPLLYGEGKKAFLRLQEEIVGNSNDLSLFAWISNDDSQFSGLFADSPGNFRYGHSLRRRQKMAVDDNVAECTVSNNGVKLSAQIKEDVLLLDCFVTEFETLPSFLMDKSSTPSQHQVSWIGIKLANVGNSYVRASPNMFFMIASPVCWFFYSGFLKYSIRKHLTQLDIAELQSMNDSDIYIEYQEVAHLLDTRPQILSEAWHHLSRGLSPRLDPPCLKMVRKTLGSTVALQTFKLGSSEFVIIVGLQAAQDPDYAIWCGIFPGDLYEESLPRITGRLECNDELRTKIWCGILTGYTDEAGYVNPQNLPQSVELWKGTRPIRISIKSGREDVSEDWVQKDSNQFWIHVHYEYLDRR